MERIYKPNTVPTKKGNPRKYSCVHLLPSFLPIIIPPKKNIISGGLPTNCYFHHSRCPLWGTPQWTAPQVERNGNLRTCHDHRPQTSRWRSAWCHGAGQRARSPYPWSYFLQPFGNQSPSSKIILRKMAPISWQSKGTQPTPHLPRIRPF